VGRPKKIAQRNDGGLSQTPVALLRSLALALAFRDEGREMLDEHLGVVLKDVVDGKGKRLGRNVCPVLAAELQVIAPFIIQR
jgi:hypothetical protein